MKVKTAGLSFLMSAIKNPIPQNVASLAGYLVLEGFVNTRLLSAGDDDLHIVVPVGNAYFDVSSLNVFDGPKVGTITVKQLIASRESAIRAILPFNGGYTTKAAYLYTSLQHEIAARVASMRKATMATTAIQ